MQGDSWHFIRVFACNTIGIMQGGTWPFGHIPVIAREQTVVG